MMIYRNLNAQKTSSNRWSYRPKGQKTQHAARIIASAVTVKQPSGKGFEECLAGGHRAVFAWFKSDDVNIDMDDGRFQIPSNAVRIFFNPKRGDRFFHTQDGSRVDFIESAYFTESGECFGVL